MKKYTSCNDVKISNKIEFIEDPILSIELTKKDFEENYLEICNSLVAEQGYLDTTIEYYFELSPLRNNYLIFRNEEKKVEFYDIGLELNCVIQLNKIHEGIQNE